MKAESILTVFREKRKSLDNVTAKNVNPRIKAFVEYCKSVPEIEAIIQSHVDQYPPLLKETSNVRPPQVGLPDEIVSIGLHLMDKCSEGEELYVLAGSHGIVRAGQDRFPDDYVHGAMAQYIYPALDYLESRIKQTVETSDELEDERLNESSGNIVAKIGRADVLKSLNLLTEAQEAYEKIITEHPENIVAKIGRAEVLKAQGRLDEALQAYEQIITDQPEDVVAKTGRADVLKAQGRVNEYELIISEDDDYLVGFRSKLTNIGKELFDKVIEVVKSDSSFILNATSSSYININIKKPRRVALQIHRIVDDMSLLGFAIAGWDKDEPEIKNRYAIVRRNIEGLSGLHDTPQENYWLRGKINSKAETNVPPNEAKVFVIDSGILEVGELWDGLKKLLQYAKESTKKGYAIDELSTKETDEAELFEKYYNLLAPTSKTIVDGAMKMAQDKWGMTGVCTTTYLFFEMVERGKSTSTRLNTARFFREMIAKDSSLEILAIKREEYFKEIKKGGAKYPWQWQFVHTNSGNVATSIVSTLNLAAEFADKTRNGKIHVRHLFLAMLLYRPPKDESGVRDMLQGLGLTVEGVLDGFPKHLERFKGDDQEAWGWILRGILEKPLASETESKISAVVGGIPTMQVEGVGGEDWLGREKLVQTLAGMFAKTECDYGFTMALLGDWGQGKSTVMELLKAELREKHEGEFKFAKYNAWEYENTDNIAAGIAQEVVGGLMKNAGSWKTIGLQIRFAGTEHRQELAYLLFYFLLTINILLWGVPLINRFDFFEGFVRELLGISGAIGVGVLAVYSLKVLKQTFEHPIAVKMRTYLKLPDYGEHLGLLPVLKSHIERLCSLLLGKERKLVVFVDDLDRCNVDHISKVLDAIRLVMTTPNVIVMIGIDHNIAFKAVGKHYELLAEREDGNKRTSAEVARDYLGKIIQLPLRLMPASNVGLKEYVEKKLFDEKDIVDDNKAVITTEGEGFGKKTSGDTIPGTINTEGLSSNSSTEDESLTDISRTSASGGAENEGEVSDETISEAIRDTKSERDEFYKLAEMYEFRNPRQLLRLHNSFRFLKGFGSGQGEKGYHTLDMLRMLFWQEFLHNWPMKIRGRCMAVLIDKVHAGKVESIVRRVLNNVKDDIHTLFNEEPTRYEELAKFVRVVVPPHNEEGVLDSAEAIKEWLKKMDEEEADDPTEEDLDE